MWKLIIFSKTCLSELEFKLDNMDTIGYQLDHVLFGVLYYFKKKNNPKSGKYRVHLGFAKMFDYQLNDLEGVFIKKCYANPVKTDWHLGLVYINIWKYSKAPEESFLQKIDEAHNCFILRIIKSQLIIDVYLLISFTIITLYEWLKVRQRFYIDFWSICTILLLVLVVYRLYELKTIKRRFG